MAASSMAATTNSTQNSKWLTDIGASDHVTPDLAQLSLHQQPTVGNESVTVGNGQELPITHIGNGKLATPSHAMGKNYQSLNLHQTYFLFINCAFKIMPFVILVHTSS